jgi:hypothetical protein
MQHILPAWRPPRQLMIQARTQQKGWPLIEFSFPFSEVEIYP